LRDLKVTLKKSTSSKPLTCETSVKVLFRRHVYSNSSAGLEKSAHGVRKSLHKVCGTLLRPPPFGALLGPAKGLVGKEVFTFEKIVP
jgi:hypothetical protein